MTNANNFASLNLSKLEKSILEDSCTLEFSCSNFNVRTLRLRGRDGKLIIALQGFTYIPCLIKLEAILNQTDDDISFDVNNCFVRGIIDTKLDAYVFAGATINIQKSSSGQLLITLENKDINLLLQREDLNIAFLLDKVEISS